MRQNPAANSTIRIVAGVLLFVGLALAPLLDTGTAGLITADSPGIEASPPEVPRFQISWQQGQLALSGHTMSRQHEQDLLQVANSSYTDVAVLTNYQPLGIVPSHWGNTTMQVLYLLAETASAQAKLSVENITIRGVIDNELAWQGRLDALKKALPAHLTIKADTVLVDATIKLSAVCEQVFAAFDSGAINFEESSANFRSSAYPRLDRVIALANTCVESRLAIAGHSDASGNESWNKRLSLRRANTVGDYFVAGGIDRTRLQVSGVGSTVPIADDSTGYGRSLNRRIEITLSNAE